MAVEHGGVGRECRARAPSWISSQRVGLRLAGVAQFFRDARGKNFRAAAGHRVQARRNQAIENFVDGKLPALREVVDLRGGEGLDLKVGVRFANRADVTLVVLEGPIGMMPAHDVHLVHLGCDVRDDFLGRHFPRAVVVAAVNVVAELAVEHTNVGGIDVHVDHEVHAFAVFLPRDEIRHAAQRRQVARFEHGDAVGRCQAFPRAHALPDGDQARVGKCDAVNVLHGLDENGV